MTMTVDLHPSARQLTATHTALATRYSARHVTMTNAALVMWHLHHLSSAPLDRHHVTLAQSNTITITIAITIIAIVVIAALITIVVVAVVVAVVIVLVVKLRS